MISLSIEFAVPSPWHQKVASDAFHSRNVILSIALLPPTWFTILISLLGIIWNQQQLDKYISDDELCLKVTINNELIQTTLLKHISNYSSLSPQIYSLLPVACSLAIKLIT
jgi:hypothetical protein